MARVMVSIRVRVRVRVRVPAKVRYLLFQVVQISKGAGTAAAHITLWRPAVHVSS